MKMQQLKSPIVKHVIKCNGQNQAIDMCTNPQCKQKILFTCGTRLCNCRKSHSSCSKADVDQILNKIQEKINQSDKLKDHVEKLFDEIIDKISTFRENLLTRIDKDLKLKNLHQVQRHFLKIIQNQNNSQMFTSEQASFLWKNLFDKNQVKSKPFQQVYKILEQYKKNSQQKLNQLKQMIDNSIQFSKQQYNQNSEIIQTIIEASSICKQKVYASRLINFFPKKIKKVQLLYKASLYDFSMLKFYQLCRSKTHTIILCLTNKDKIVGGYTPFNYYSGKSQYVKDEKAQSFMFSLSNNDRFNLTEDRKYCIYRSLTQGHSTFLQFGNGQIMIRDKANQQNNCQIGLQKHLTIYYSNPNYNMNDKQSYIRLSGNQTHKCSLKQWQCWKVQFQDQK